MTRCPRSGATPSIRDSRYPRGTRTAPGRWPASHSSCSRTSMMTTPSSRSSRTSAGSISSTWARACLTCSDRETLIALQRIATVGAGNSSTGAPRASRSGPILPMGGLGPMPPSASRPLAPSAPIPQVRALTAALISALLLAATVVAGLDLSSAVERERLLVLVAAVLGTILVNGMVLRRRFEPLERVIAAMEDVSFGPGGYRPSMPAAGSAEVARLNSAFERMLDRLEAERSRTAGLVLRGQEEERARLARDLHDEANQALTAVLLRLQATALQAPPALRGELRATQ